MWPFQRIRWKLSNIYNPATTTQHKSPLTISDQQQGEDHVVPSKTPFLQLQGEGHVPPGQTPVVPHPVLPVGPQ